MKVICSKIFFVVFLVFVIGCNTSGLDESRIPDQEFQSTKITTKENQQLKIGYKNAEFLQGKFKVLENQDGQTVLYTESGNNRHFFILKHNQKKLDINEIQRLQYLKDLIVINGEVYKVKGNVNEQQRKDAQLFVKGSRNPVDLFALAHYSFDTNEERTSSLSALEIWEQFSKEGG